MTDSGPVPNVMADGSSVEDALQRAALVAQRQYIRAGLSMPVWRGGRLVWVEPTELEQHDPGGHAANRGHHGDEGIGAI